RVPPQKPETTTNGRPKAGIPIIEHPSVLSCYMFLYPNSNAKQPSPSLCGHGWYSW
ncbi:hypothetical protein JB92DRAFT_3049242, partial [Gautieria morchelliformis]